MQLRRAVRAGCAAAAGLLLALAAPVAGTVPAHAADSSGKAKVTMRVADVTPDAPRSSQHARPLEVVLEFHNATDQTLKVSIAADRGYPIDTLVGFEHAVAQSKTPDPNALLQIRTRDDTLAPGDSTFVFRTSTGINSDAELCECEDKIYPLYFTARYTDDNGLVKTLASARTFIPSLPSPAPLDGKKVAKLHVGWVWPLLDRPHRIGLNPNVFTDDDLAQEIAPGGRLDTLLQVVERVAERVPMTLVVDPDLLDELQVMSQGPYQLQPPGKPVTTVRTGTLAARTWLQRLRNVLSINGMEIALTPAGDPDVDSVARNHLDWTVGLTQQQQSNVTAALGGRTPLSDISWPVGGQLSPVTLNRLASQGTNTVILADSALRGGPAVSGPVPTRDALATVPTATGSVEAAVTSSRVQRLVAKVLDRGYAGLATLPRLTAVLALRVIGSLHESHYLTIVAPRALNTDPKHPLDVDVAVRLITQTAHTSWATAEPLRQAASSITPTEHARLAADTRTAGFPPNVLDTINYVTESVPGLYTLFPNPADAVRVHLDTLPTTVQRLESCSLLDAPDKSTAAAVRVRKLMDRLRQKSVYLVPPANGRDYSYTLTSNKSSVTVTVVNNLTVPVDVRLDVSRTSGPPGFTAGDTGEQLINPGLKKQIKIPTQVSVLGRYQIGVQLSTPSGLTLGNVVELSVRSTALGTVGVVITVVAGVVLAVALLVRVTTRLRRRRRKAALHVAGPSDSGAAPAR